MCAWCSLPTWIWCLRSPRHSSSSNPSTPSTPSTPAVIDRSAVKSSDQISSKWYDRCGRGIKGMPTKCAEGCKRTLANGCKKEEIVVGEEEKEEKVTESMTQASLDPFLSSADQVEPVVVDREEENSANELNRIKTRTPDLHPIAVPSKTLGAGFVDRCKRLVGGGRRKEGKEGK